MFGNWTNGYGLFVLHQAPKTIFRSNQSTFFAWNYLTSATELACISRALAVLANTGPVLVGRCGSKSRAYFYSQSVPGHPCIRQCPTGATPIKNVWTRPCACSHLVCRVNTLTCVIAVLISLWCMVTGLWSIHY